LIFLPGANKGKWITSLITPDKKELTSQKDLKLYIAKSGAVIDANIVNFSLPKKIAKIDKNLEKLLAKSEELKQPVVKPSSETEVEKVKDGVVESQPEDGDKSLSNADIDLDVSVDKESNEQTEKKVKREMKKLGISNNEPGIELASPGRRESKLPMKYRLDDPVTNPPAKKPRVAKASKNAADKSLNDSAVSEASEEKMDLDAPEPVTAAPVQETVTPGPSFVAVKSVPPPPSSPRAGFEPSYESSTSLKTLPTLGVGTFAIDEETAKSKSLIDPLPSFFILKNFFYISKNLNVSMIFLFLIISLT